MRWIICLMMTLGSSFAFAEESKIIIQHGEKEVAKEQEKKQSREFCSQVSASEAKKTCELWIADQKSSLGDRYLTSYCSFGKATTRTDGCMYSANGDISYLLRVCEVKP